MKRRDVFILPGLNLAPHAFTPLSQALSARGFQVRILPMADPRDWKKALEEIQDHPPHMTIGFSLGGLLLANVLRKNPRLKLKVALLAPALFLRPWSWAPNYLFKIGLPGAPSFFRRYCLRPFTPRHVYQALYREVREFQEGVKKNPSCLVFQDLFLATHPWDELICAGALFSWAHPLHRLLRQDFRARSSWWAHHFNFCPDNMGELAFDNLLDELQAHGDSSPFPLLSAWFQRAQESEGPHLPFSLATSSLQGEVSCRTLLSKGLRQESGGMDLIFVGQTGSQKGRQIKQNPRGAAVFYWPTLGLQVRLEGPVRELAPEDSDQLFRERPWEKQLSSSLGIQSAPLSHPEDLWEQFETLARQNPRGTIERPSHWVGYALSLKKIEFFCYRQDRLNQRKVYVQEGGEWVFQWVSP